MSHQRVATTCPSCSPDEPTVHEVLSGGSDATVRCSACGHVHKTMIEEEPTIERRIIVSQEGDSIETRVKLPPDEELSVGEEFLVETDDAILTARATSLETVEGARTEREPAESVRTIWSRAVGNVAVNLTLHPKDGRHDDTRSMKIQVPGDESFVVGETHDYADESFTVERVLVREDATEYDREAYERRGDTVLAKDVKRVYARDEETSPRAWSGW